MGDVIDLHPANIIENLEFISDCCRFAENILTEAAVKKKYRFDDAEWERLGNDEKLLEAIELEKVRRIRSGQQKRERAQVLMARGPDVLGAIMSAGGDVSPRHKIDAVRTLDTLAANGPEAAPAADRFVIQINLGSDVLKFDKSIEINPNDVDPNDAADTGLIAALAAKPTESDGGNTL